MRLAEVPVNGTFATRITAGVGTVLEQRFIVREDGITTKEVEEVKVDLFYPTGQRSRRWLHAGVLVDTMEAIFADDEDDVIEQGKEDYP